MRAFDPDVLPVIGSSQRLAAAVWRIVNEINGVSRVVHNISGKRPATIEWE